MLSEPIRRDGAVRADPDGDDQDDIDRVPDTAAPSEPPRPVLRSTWVPGGVLVVAAVASLLRNGVAPGDVLVYAGYWLVTLLVPGLLVCRAMLGGRPTLTEDLAFGALTGIALQIVAFVILRLVGLDNIVSWWWVPIYGAFAAIGSLRRCWFVRYPARASVGWAWSMGALCLLSVVAIDAGTFRANAIPPASGTVYIDLWYHLSLVQELMRSGSLQMPQVAGEPLSYHVYSHAHVAIGTRVTGIDPEVVLFRLWPIPLVVVMIGLLAGLARQVSARAWAGPVAVWLALFALNGGYLWEQFGVFGPTPVVQMSPSQLMVNALVVGAGSALITIVRHRGAWTTWVWLGTIAFASSGAKPTGLVVLAGGMALAVVGFLLFERRILWQWVVGLLGLLGMLGWALASGRGASGTVVTVFGTLKSVAIYRTLSGDTALRAVNDGLMLDGLFASRSALVAAGVAVSWLFVTHVVRLVGLGLVAHPATRRDMASWWLVGAAISGWLVIAVLDHAGLGQIYFLHTATPFAAVATAWFVVIAVGSAPARSAAPALLIGLGVGMVAQLVSGSVSAAMAARESDFGVLDQLAVPLIVSCAVVAIGFMIWRGVKASVKVDGLGLLFVLAVLLGVAVPPSLESSASRIGRALAPAPVADASSVDYLTEPQLEAALWLRENSDPDDVVVTNLHCRPAPYEPACDARGFWFGGLSGRRAVLDAWAYTPRVRELYEGDGAIARQPPPYPTRYELSQSIVAEASVSALKQVKSEYRVDWIVGIRAAGEVSDALDTVADAAFDNGEVAIYRVP